MNFVQTAQSYVDNGFSVIAIGQGKKSLYPWKKYQSERPGSDELKRQFGSPGVIGIGVICGAVSGGLEVIDIDTKYDVTGRLYANYCRSIVETDEDLFYSLRIIQTQSGGYHFYYRCEEIQGNQKLAQRAATAEEKNGSPHLKIQVLIETRGEAGYVIASPTEGYQVIQDKKVPVISIEQRDILLSCARSFNQVIEPAQPVKTATPTNFSLSPFEDYNRRGDMLSDLIAHGWSLVSQNSKKIFLRRPGKDKGTSGDILVEKNWFSVFTTSSEFEPMKAYNPAAVFCKLNCDDNWAKCARLLMDMGYGQKRIDYGDKVQRQIFKLKQEGKSHDDLIKYVQKNHEKSESEAVEMIDELDRQWGDQLLTFWLVSDKRRVSMAHSAFIEFLMHTGGFGLYFYDPKSVIFRLVQTRSGIIQQSSTERIKKYIWDYIEGLPDFFDGIEKRDLLDMVTKGANTYFSEGMMEWIKEVRFDMLRDTREKAFYVFKNGVVEVTRNGVLFKELNTLKMNVWAGDVIDREIFVDPKDGDCDFKKFCYLVAGQDFGRFSYLCSLIGYMLHKFKDFTRPWAVVLAEENDNEEQGGGTGKGILVKAIGHLIKSTMFDGKQLNLHKGFAFQRVELDTRLVAFEDCQKGIQFENFYSMLTEGMTVEKKNKDELYIRYEDSPKILFTTNYTIPAKGNHGKRRQKVFEFAPFFHAGMTPQDYFGHHLFHDWDDQEWNRFYNFLFGCVSVYLSNGVEEPEPSDMILNKQIKQQYGAEFLEWFDGFVKDKDEVSMSAKDMYGEFIELNNMERKDYSPKRFRAALEGICKLRKYEFGVYRRDREKREQTYSINMPNMGGLV